MEGTRDKIVELVHRTVDDLNQELEDGAKLDRGAETVLYGPGATTDSITLVSLIVAVEESIRREFGLSVTLANEKAMSMERSPFRTLDSMIGYVLDVVRESQGE